MTRIVAALVLAGVAWPALAPVVSPGFRHTFPTLAGGLAVALAAYGAAVLLLVASAPLVVVHGLTALGVGAAIALWWWSAETRGRARRWPPGSLRPLSLRPWLERGFFAAEHRRHGSPFKAPQFFRPTACVVGLADGLALVREHEDAIATPPLPFSRFIPGGFFRYMPPPAHAAAKDVLRTLMTPDVYEPLAPFMRTVIAAELARLATASGAAGGLGVAPRPALERMVFTIWARVFFHVEPESAVLARLRTLYAVIDIRNPSGASDAAIRTALTEIAAILRAQRARTGAHPSGGPASFLDALVRRHPHAIDDPTIVGNLTYLLNTTWGDVSGLLQWLFRMLTEHGAWAEQLRQPDPEPADTLPLATRIVMETLRLEQSEYVYRVATCPIEHGGRVIPRGWLIRLCVRESHQDAAVFAHPERFDPDRFRHRTYARHEYAPFGIGLRHGCLGEGLTKTVGALFVAELARGYHWRTIADGPYEQSAWRHWRPSSAWRIQMTPTA